MIIYSAWLQGRAKAPDLVRRIFDLWEAYNPECRFHVVEQAEADAILDDFGIRQMRITPQVTTDLVRKALLCRTGGVWVDATLLPTRPLADWLRPDLTAEGFFAFRSTGDPNLVLQNWFLYSAKANPLMQSWLDLFADYFRRRRLFPTWRRALVERQMPAYWAYLRRMKNRETLWFADASGGRDTIFYPYAIANYNFAYLLQSNADLAKVWAKVPKQWAELPHLIGRFAQDPETLDTTFFEAAEEILTHSPVHKLNYRDHRFLSLAERIAIPGSI